MARAPFAEWLGPVPSTNYAKGPTPKIGVVVHVVVGSASSAIHEFTTTDAQLSAHFVVADGKDVYADGHIVQLVDTDDDAYAQGDGNYAPTAYIAIEFAGVPADPMTVAQVLSGAKIVAWASRQHGFPVVGPVEHGVPGVTPHCHPNGSPDPSWGGHPCPEQPRLGQIPGMVWLAAQAVKPPPPPPTPTEDDMQMAYTDFVSGKVVMTDAAGNIFVDGGGIPDLKILTLGELKAGDAGTATNPCVGICAWRDSAGAWGYCFITKPVSGVGSCGPWNTYHIHRNGTPG